MKESDFIRHYITNAPQIMWLLGAGTSRTAGMPTATDITWDLKIKYYCEQENQDIKSHDKNNETVKRRVQNFLESKGFPKLWSAEEYSFYFDLMFQNNNQAQQQYLNEQLNNAKISLNRGHKILGGLLAMEKVKIIFTTNFDEVIEHAYLKVAEKNLATYHLEGSYGAVDALNSERFPIYTKLHGDFKYQSVKNLTQDLLNNDQKLQDAFLAAATRYGLIVSGYSGRDKNVMNMLSNAIQMHNAFPSGLFWTVPSLKDVIPEVINLIEKAKALNINAHIIETGTFDIMLSKIWRQFPDKLQSIEDKVCATNFKEVSISLPPAGNAFPILRTNALPILELPAKCARITTENNLDYPDLITLLRTNKPNAILTKADYIIGFGNKEDFKKGLDKQSIQKIEDHILEDQIGLISKYTFYKNFFERALVASICNDRPVKLRTDKKFYIVIDKEKENDPIFSDLKKALNSSVTGTISKDVTWSEAIEVKVELKNGRLYLMMKPSTWVDPRSERKNNLDFIKTRRLKRYNHITNAIFDAWIKILFNPTMKNETIKIGCYNESDFPAQFQINTRSLYSKRNGPHG